ncbi:MAG TPA: tetratricopeptide repeat protein [Terracidiphilus sp.]|jgi:tetratricopeptide (TPR) repeat protein
MNTGVRTRILWLAASLVLCALAAAQDSSKQNLDRQYQAAVSDYEAGRYAQAAGELEKLLPYAPRSYELHELSGMVYAAQSQNDEAIDHLKTAVQIKPELAEARINLGATLARAGKPEWAAEQFRKAVELEPKNYDANHNLGEFYVQTGKLAAAQPYLDQAFRIHPEAYDNGYDLAMADFLLGKRDQGREVINALIKLKDTGELRNLLGQIDEKDGKYVEAANDYEAAAHLDPTEDNIFDWGGEMLLHRTYEPAIAIFQQGTERFPKSPRMFIGLGLSYYSRGIYDKAITALIAAADLNPADPRCYVFLSKAYNSSPLQVDEVIQRFRRYAELQPGNALAQYYYAVSLWKGKRVSDPGTDMSAVASLLEKAISLDDSLAEAHVQLGNLYADQHKYEQSIPQYVRALQLDQNLPDAHYRLGTDYVHTGQKEEAQKEFAIYQKLRAEHLAEVEKERAQMQQFVYSEKAPAASKP